jgi:hypothetical protein
VALHYACHRSFSPPNLSGFIDDPVWDLAAWTADFVDIEGNLKPKPRFRTRAKMLWDETTLYIAAEMEEPDVWGALTAHDSVIFHDPDFEVFLDPDGDNHDYAELEVNALNTTWDLFLPRPYRDGGKADDRFEIDGLRTAVRVSGSLNHPGDRDQGWTVEIALPWSSFAKYARKPTPPKDGDQWRVNFSRVEWRHRIRDGRRYEAIPKTSDNWVWSPQGEIAMHRPEFWGYVQFAAGEPGSVTFRPDPTWPARARLVAVYDAQQRFRRETGRWARSLGKLGLASGDPPIEYRLTPEGFEASVAVPSGRVSIRQDSRIRPGSSPDSP